MSIFVVRDSNPGTSTKELAKLAWLQQVNLSAVGHFARPEIGMTRVLPSSPSLLLPFFHSYFLSLTPSPLRHPFLHFSYHSLLIFDSSSDPPVVVFLFSFRFPRL